MAEIKLQGKLTIGVGPKGADGKMTFEDLTEEQKQSLKGDKGDTGAQGPIGPQGKEGKEGKQGPKGEQGLQGPIGLTGPKGDQGPKGETGATGPQGERGLTGEQGIKGDTGEQGPEGPAGKDGKDADMKQVDAKIQEALAGFKPTSSGIPTIKVAFDAKKKNESSLTFDYYKKSFDRNNAFTLGSDLGQTNFTIYVPILDDTEYLKSATNAKSAKKGDLIDLTIKTYDEYVINFLVWVYSPSSSASIYVVPINMKISKTPNSGGGPVDDKLIILKAASNFMNSSSVSQIRGSLAKATSYTYQSKYITNYQDAVVGRDAVILGKYKNGDNYAIFGKITSTSGGIKLDHYSFIGYEYPDSSKIQVQRFVAYNAVGYSEEEMTNIWNGSARLEISTTKRSYISGVYIGDSTKEFNMMNNGDYITFTCPDTGNPGKGFRYEAKITGTSSNTLYTTGVSLERIDLLQYKTR